MANIEIYLDSQLLPVPTNLKEVSIPTETNVTTLDATLYTDFVNNRRVWEVEWAWLCKEDYDAIRAIYDNQYNSKVFVSFVVDYYNINVMAKVSIKEKDIRWDGNNIRDFSIRIEEKNAVS